ncbi:Ribosomal protein L11 methyltransferase [Arsenophonus endosymbiont of Bemisia tabaci Q2]|nr:Ribosomal protein L11 methyltransferase [Arsenophonus endosymbiont of Bemisia tabaci Q2]
MKDKTVIDFGCASGILAIAALKLGAKKAIGIDIDPQAIQASHNNAEQNRVADKLVLYLAKDQAEDLKADIVIAIAKRLNFDYKIYVFLQYKFTDIE